MNKRVYGVLGIKSIMANWNADFSGYPKTISSGETFGSDKAFKFPMKKMWDEKGEKVLYLKSLKAEEDKKEGIKVRPKSLKERFEEIFKIADLSTIKDSREIYKNLFSAVDVKNFGATFAEQKNNIGIIGAVQIGQGFNKYEDTTPEEQQILSPFRVEKASASNSSAEKEEANATTLGTKIVSNEAHYFYPFSINPLVYKPYIEMGVTEGYTEEDYENFKKTSIVAATAFNSNSKIGCENEFAIFIEVNEEQYLPDLSQYIEFEKKEDKNIIRLNFDTLINDIIENVINVEIYFNPYTTILEGSISKSKVFNIFTGKEV